jgi:hypothetical protein
MVPGQPKTQSKSQAKAKRAKGMTQVAEHLPRLCEALGWIPIPPPKKKKTKLKWFGKVMTKPNVYRELTQLRKGIKWFILNLYTTFQQGEVTQRS